MLYITVTDIRHFRDRCDVLETANSSAKNGIRIKVRTILFEDKAPSTNCTVSVLICHSDRRNCSFVGITSVQQTNTVPLSIPSPYGNVT